MVAATGLYVVYLATDYASAARLQPMALLDLAEGLGAGGYVAVGAVGLLAGGAYLANVVGLGHSGNLISGGTIAILNVVVGVEVAGGFAPAGRRFPRPDSGDPVRGASVSVLAYGVAAWLFVIGVYGVVTSRNLIHMVVCLSVAQSATDLLLLEVGYTNEGHAPVFVGLSAHPGPAVDPLVQALGLTDVVVGAAVTGLLMAMVIQVHKRTGTLDPDELAATRD